MNQKELFSLMTQEAPGALKNGTRVEKVGFEEGDGHEPGMLATIIGSIGPHDHEGISNVFGYFVCWDDMPYVPVLVTSLRVIEHISKVKKPEIPLGKKVESLLKQIALIYRHGGNVNHFADTVNKIIVVDGIKVVQDKTGWSVIQL